MNLLSSNDVLYYPWWDVIHWHPREGASHIPQKCIPVHRPETDSENNFCLLNKLAFYFLPREITTKTPYMYPIERIFLSFFSKHQKSKSKQSDGFPSSVALSVFVRRSTLNTSLVLLTLALPAVCVVSGRSFRSCLVIKSDNWMVDIAGGKFRSKLGITRNIWSNYSDLTWPGPPKGSWGREISLVQWYLSWWNIIIWPDNILFPWVSWGPRGRSVETCLWF